MDYPTESAPCSYCSSNPALKVVKLSKTPNRRAVRELVGSQSFRGHERCFRQPHKSNSLP